MCQSAISLRVGNFAKCVSKIDTKTWLWKASGGCWNGRGPTGSHALVWLLVLSFSREWRGMMETEWRYFWLQVSLNTEWISFGWRTMKSMCQWSFLYSWSLLKNAPKITRHRRTIACRSKIDNRTSRSTFCKRGKQDKYKTSILGVLLLAEAASSRRSLCQKWVSWSNNLQANCVLKTSLAAKTKRTFLPRLKPTLAHSNTWILNFVSWEWRLGLEFQSKLCFACVFCVGLCQNECIACNFQGYLKKSSADGTGTTHLQHVLLFRLFKTDFFCHTIVDDQSVDLDVSSYWETKSTGKGCVPLDILTLVKQVCPAVSCVCRAKLPRAKTNIYP